ncbi:RusA family crossover junction endodeoxyribonuclease [Bradyrhizobium symbiodeficiens]|uniref:RusA family crossover junction endodeoxyribonuclease n=1 Tax=Bradyrhizobium symbiodeficiens TaxID=1404367 RepID=UPI00140FBEA6|nr:RusA family crossover junction endodeoxyribonuclease [Bradyrhizobium symbiodeficiens]
MQSYTIVLTGEPRSTNNAYRNACRSGFSTTYMAAEGKALKEKCYWEALSQWKGNSLAGNIEVTIDLYFGTKRRADWDNFHKLSMDALTGIVWQDDSQIMKATVTKRDRALRSLRGRFSDLSTRALEPPRRRVRLSCPTRPPY